MATLDMDEIKIKVTVEENNAEDKLHSIAQTVRELASATKALESAGNANISKIASSLRSLGNVKISSASVKNIASLGDAFKSIARVNAEGLKGVVKSLTALSSFKMSPSAAKNLGVLADSLGKLKGTSVTESTVQSLQGMGELSIPDTAGKNIGSLADGLERLNSIDATQLKAITSALAELKGLNNIKINLSGGGSRASVPKNVSGGAKRGKWINMPGGTESGDAPERMVDDMSESAEDVAETTSAFLIMGATVSKVCAVLQVVKQAVGVISIIVKSIVAVVKKVADLVKQIATKILSVGKAISKVLFSPFIKVANAIQKAKGALDAFISRVKSVVLRRVISTMFRQVTDAFSTGIENMYNWAVGVGHTFASSMDRAASSMIYLKNSVAAAVSPLINAFVPALEKAVDAIVDFLNAVNQLFARLTGASTWTKAVKGMTSYADATGSAAKSAEDLKRSLIAIDEIHALDNPNSGSGGGGGGSSSGGGGTFTEMPVSNDIGALSSVWRTFAESYDKYGKTAIEKCKTAFEDVKTTVKDIAYTWAFAFISGKGTTSLQAIYGILGNIATAVSGIAKSFKEAWDYGNTGLFIVSNLWETANNLLNTWEKITASISEWASGLNLKPVLVAFEQLTRTFGSLAEILDGSVKWAWENVILPLGTYLIEDFVPKGLKTASDVLEGLSVIIDPIVQGFNDFWDATEGLRKSLKKCIDDGLSKIAGYWKSIKDNIPDEELDNIRESFSKLATVIAERLGAHLTDVVDLISSLLTDKLPSILKIIRIVGAVIIVLKNDFSGFIDLIQVFNAELSFTFALLKPGSEKERFNNISAAMLDVTDKLNDYTDAAKNSSRELKAWYDTFDSVIDGIEEGSKSASKQTQKDFGEVNTYVTGTFAPNISQKFAETMLGVKTESANATSAMQTSFGGFSNYVSTTWTPTTTTNAKTPFTNASAEATRFSDNAKTGLGGVASYVGGTFTTDMERNSKSAFGKFDVASNSSYNTLASNLNAVPGKFDTAFTKGYNNAAAAFSPGGTLQKNLDSGIGTTITNFFNNMRIAINSVLSSAFSGINKVLRKLRDLKIGSLQPFKWVNEVSVPQLANGGIVDAGQMFIANERGPELVGQFGRRTAVMNNDQIVQSVSVGVENANETQNALLREQNRLLAALLSKEGNVRAYVTTGDIVTGIQNLNKRTGRQIIAVNP